MLLARNPHRYFNSLNRKLTPKRTFCTTSGAHIPAWFTKKQHETIPKFSKLDKDTDTEVTVVGGGIAGLTSAYMLSLKGKSVVLVDDGDICSGETGRTTAHLVSGVDDRYFKLEENFGKQGAKTMADAHKTAIDTIEHIVKQEKIDCEFERLDGYLFLSPEHKVDYLKKELKSAFEAGLKVEMVDNMPLDTFASGPALRFGKQAQFDPLKYCSALAQAILKNGGKIYTNTHIESMTGNAGHFTELKAQAKTSEGHTIKSAHLIVATNVPVNDRITMYTKLEPYRSYVITSKVPKGSVPKALYWDTHDPYHYVRTTSYDSESDLLIVGGEDHKVGQAFDFEERYRNLYVWASARWKMMGPIKHKWSGQIIEPTDNVAFIGRNPSDYENVYIVTGDSGNGMTHGTIAGIMFTDMIMGKKNPWEKLFDPSRKPLSEPKEFIQHNVNVGTQYKDWVTKSEVDDISQIAVGSGAILRKGLGKIAVYRDESGNFCQYSAVCPHMKALVRWNDDEKSWDCPAHGSRFDCNGKVINGPSNCGLSPVEPEPQVTVAGEMGTSPPLFR